MSKLSNFTSHKEEDGVPELVEVGESDEEWTDDETEVDFFSPKVKCIFTDAEYPSAKNYYLFLKEKHNFDIWNLVHVDLGLDFFGYVKLINYLRSKFNGRSPPSAKELADLKEEWDNAVYLKPVLEDDLLLQFILDSDDEDIMYDNESPNQISAPLNGGGDEVSDHKGSFLEGAANPEKEVLEMKLQEANATILKMKEFMKDVILTQDVYRPVAACRSRQNGAEENEEFEDSGYFGTYSHHDIHAEMLQDTVRTNAYQEAILSNADSFKDKVVLDVGCGTGILSMFAVKAGAKHVYGVDMSDIAYQAMDIIKENNLDNKITIIKGCIEEVLLPVEKVDIIISEWMGYFLLYESMLDSVLYAAEKWLSADGLLLPNNCSVFLVAIHDEALLHNQIQFWDDVYGFRMSCIKKAAKSEALVQSFWGDNVVSRPVAVAKFDIKVVKANQLNYKTDFSMRILRSGKCSAIGAYFNIDFTDGLAHPVSFSTGPFSKATHWKQTIFFLEETISVHRGDEISGFIDCHKNPHDPRSLIVNLTFAGMSKRYTVS